MFLFNSRDLRFKSPFGAVRTDELIKIYFPVTDTVCVAGVDFVLEKDGDRQYMPMALIKRILKVISDKPPSLQDGHPSDGGKPLDNTQAAVPAGYNVYCIEFSIPDCGVYHYRFEVKKTDGSILFAGDGGDGLAVMSNWESRYQLTVYDKNYKTPDFLKGGIIYHIFADRFCKNKDIPFNKKGAWLHDDWNELPAVKGPDGVYRANDFFGGNLSGITSRLDYLKDLNVTLIYLSPIFESMSNHRYDTGDYLKIDNLLGDEDDLNELINEAEKRGMYIMLDGVFNHTGADSRYFNKFGNYDTVGAYNSKDSEYYDWYYFDRYPDKYKCWWDVTVSPTLNKSNPKYRELIFGDGGVLDKWTRTGTKGWRLDVVDELDEDFVSLLRDKIKGLNADTVIIGEVWEDASAKVSYGRLRPYLLGGQLDGTMNYPFKNAIMDYLDGGENKSFYNSVMRILENYPRPSINVMMNIISTHDTVRALTRLGGNKRKLMLAAVMQFTLPGVPSVYYGDEVGLTGGRDPLNRAPYPYGREDFSILKFYKRLSSVRTENRDAFAEGLEFIKHESLMIYRRGKIIVVINKHNYGITFSLNGRFTDLMSRREYENTAEAGAESFLILFRITV